MRMPGSVFDTGDTVELRTVEKEDVEFLQQTLNDPRVRVGIAATDPVNRIAEREWVESLGDTDSAHFLVCIDGDPVGEIGLKPPQEVWGTAEVG